jgi:hypothetical protein
MVTVRFAETMRKLKIEIFGAWLAIATGTLVMMVVSAPVPLVAMVDFFGMLNEETEPRPFISVGLSGWLCSADHHGAGRLGFT